MVKTYLIIGIIFSLVFHTLVSLLVFKGKERSKITAVMSDAILWPIVLWIIIYQILKALQKAFTRKTEES